MTESVIAIVYAFIGCAAVFGGYANWLYLERREESNNKKAVKNKLSCKNMSQESANVAQPDRCCVCYNKAGSHPMVCDRCSEGKVCPDCSIGMISALPECEEVTCPVCRKGTGLSGAAANSDGIQFPDPRASIRITVYSFSDLDQYAEDSSNTESDSPAPDPPLFDPSYCPFGAADLSPAVARGISEAFYASMAASEGCVDEVVAGSMFNCVPLFKLSNGYTYTIPEMTAMLLHGGDMVTVSARAYWGLMDMVFPVLTEVCRGRMITGDCCKDAANELMDRVGMSTVSGTILHKALARVTDGLLLEGFSDTHIGKELFHKAIEFDDVVHSMWEDADLNAHEIAVSFIFNMIMGVKVDLDCVPGRALETVVGFKIVYPDSPNVQAILEARIGKK